MKAVSKLFLSALAIFALTAGVWAAPAVSHATRHAIPAQAAAATQSVSGTIASVEQNSFSLTVASQKSKGMQNTAAQDPAAPKTMTFQIDKNTAIDGKLAVGANADVTYRADNGNNIAVSVHVSQ
ncbi:MAG TPA: hypothetical protein VLY23_02560 [Candidatus Acidoferrum sp.]|nr:hypothetical protein [Candidatus Acidoferrum sp.]